MDLEGPLKIGILRILETNCLLFKKMSKGHIKIQNENMNFTYLHPMLNQEHSSNRFYQCNPFCQQTEIFNRDKF